MKLSISNIAWDVTEDEGVIKLLEAYEVDSIDVAPSKYIKDFAAVGSAELLQIRKWRNSRGISIIGMQSLLFGTNDLNIFGGSESQSRMLRHLDHVCRIGDSLDARRLVFGSPKNRNRTGLSDAHAEEVAIDFFYRLGGIATKHGVVMCLELNPECYGSNFMVSSEETARLVKLVDHPGIRMQFDTGALTIKGEDPEDLLARYGSLIGHVHASEPNLIPVGDGSAPLERIFQLLFHSLPLHAITIEMVATKSEPHLDSVNRSLACVSGLRDKIRQNHFVKDDRKTSEQPNSSRTH